MSNEIKLFGVIGEDVRANEVKDQIDAMDQTQPLTVRINSEGGMVFDGLAIYDAIASYKGPKKAVVESFAASIASLIPMACDEIEITENGYFMIHNPHSAMEGDDEAFAKASTELTQFKETMVNAYASRTGKPREEILSVMKAETFFNAQQAIEYGLANRTVQPKLMRATAYARLKNMPQGVLSALCGARADAGDNRETTKEQPMSNTQPVAASLAEIRAAFPRAKADFVLHCLEKNLPMASVMTEALAAMEEENMALKAKLAEYESAKPEEPMAMEVEVEEDPEEAVPSPAAKAKATPKAQAKKASGVKPIAKATQTSGGVSAKAMWESKIAAKVATGLPRAQAVRAVIVENPNLREQMLAEVNS